MRLGHTALMVTQDGYHAVCLVVRIQLLLDSRITWRVIVELLLERPRGVVGTENLRRKALHVRCQVLVERSCL